MNKKPSEKSKLVFKLLLLLSAVAVMLGLLSFVGKKSSESVELVASNFATYDILRAITKDTNQDVKLLVQPGTDIHHYEPSQQDIIDIQASKLFVFVGGESEEWVESIIQDEQKTLKLMNVEGLTVLNEDGEDEIDEHIWIAPSNFILMLQATEKKLSEIYPENSAKYQENADEYITKIQEASSQIKTIAKDLPTMIFADRFPLAGCGRDSPLRRFYALQLHVSGNPPRAGGHLWRRHPARTGRYEESLLHDAHMNHGGECHGTD